MTSLGIVISFHIIYITIDRIKIIHFIYLSASTELTPSLQMVMVGLQIKRNKIICLQSPCSVRLYLSNIKKIVSLFSGTTKQNSFIYDQSLTIFICNECPFLLICLPLYCIFQYVKIMQIDFQMISVRSKVSNTYSLEV